ncbi:sensor histidine kinase [Bacteroidota bacterium]
MPGKITYKNFSFGYTFEDNKEVISLIFINYMVCLIFGAIVVMLHVADEKLILVSYRYHGIIALSLLNLLLIRFKLPKIARMNLLILLPFLLMLLPHIAGLVDNEFYFWFQYIPIGLSLIAHFTFKPRKEQVQLFTFLIIYLFLGLFIDNIMIALNEEQVEIIPIVQEHSFYYNLIPVLLYIFVNVALGLIFRQNDLYESRLHHDGQVLEETNQKLSNQKQKLLEKNRDLDNTLKQLYEARDKLVQSEKLAALGTLTAGIAHEINNPLNFISVSLAEMATLVNQHPDLFDNKSKIEQKNHYLNLMHYAEEGVDRVTEIVTKLGTLKSRKVHSTQNISIDELVHAAIMEIQASIPSFINIVNDIPDKLRIDCKLVEVQQVVQNIISNAVDAIAGKKERQDEQIIITAYSETVENQKYVTISISNTGPLIPEKTIQKIFDPFYTTKSQGEGSGLGLSVSFNTIQENKGTITAENRENMVVFLISLPEESR